MTVPIGKIIGVHGVRGEVKVALYGDLEFPWKEVLLLAGSRGKRLKVLGARPHKGVMLVSFEGYSTRNDAGLIVGCELAVVEEELPEPEAGEYYYKDLLGSGVWTEGGRYVGKVENIFPTGSNDVLEVKGPMGEVLIPAIEGVIVAVDPENKRITIRPIEGLLPEAEEEGS